MKKRFLLILVVFVFALSLPVLAQDKPAKSPLEIMPRELLVYGEFKNFDKHFSDMFTILYKEKAEEKKSEYYAKLDTLVAKLFTAFSANLKDGSPLGLTPETLKTVETLFNSFKGILGDVDSGYFLISDINYSALTRLDRNIDTKLTSFPVDFVFALRSKTSNALQTILENKEFQAILGETSAYKNVKTYSIDMTKVMQKAPAELKDAMSVFTPRFFFTVDALFLTFDSNILKEMIDRSLGGTAPSLKDNPVFSKLGTINYNDCSAFFVMSFDKLFSGIRTVMPIEISQQLDMVEPVLGLSSFGEMIVFTQSTPQKIEEGFLLTLKKEHELYNILRAAPAKKNSFEVIPDNCIYAYIGGIENAGKMYSNMVAYIDKHLSKLSKQPGQGANVPNIKSEIEKFEQIANIKLAGLFNSIGKEYAVFVLPTADREMISPDDFISGMCLVLSSSQPQTTSNSIIKCIESIAGGETTGAKFSEETYKDCSIKSLSMKGSTISIGVIKGYVILTSKKDTLKFVIDSIEKKKTIAENAAIKAQFDYDNLTNSSMIVYMEMKGYMDYYLSLMEATAVSQLPVELSAITENLGAYFASAASQIPVIVTGNQNAMSAEFKTLYSIELLKLTEGAVDMYINILDELGK